MSAISLAPRALYEEVAELLRQRIFKRELEPGAWIDEVKLANGGGIPQQIVAARVGDESRGSREPRDQVFAHGDLSLRDGACPPPPNIIPARPPILSRMPPPA